MKAYELAQTLMMNPEAEVEIEFYTDEDDRDREDIVSVYLDEEGKVAISWKEAPTEVEIRDRKATAERRRLYWVEQQRRYKEYQEQFQQQWGGLLP